MLNFIFSKWTAISRFVFKVGHVGQIPLWPMSSIAGKFLRIKKSGKSKMSCCGPTPKYVLGEKNPNWKKKSSWVHQFSLHLPGTHGNNIRRDILDQDLSRALGRVLGLLGKSGPMNTSTSKPCKGVWLTKVFYWSHGFCSTYGLPPMIGGTVRRLKDRVASQLISYNSGPLWKPTIGRSKS